MIGAQSLVKRFGSKEALAGISFSVAEGQIYGLLGPNGAGKTTTTRILACLLRPDSGTAYVAGHDVRSHPEKVRESIGILTEIPGLYERLNAYEYLDFFGTMHGLDGPRRRGRIEELMRLLGVWDMRAQRLRSFSKGMKQKVAIARTLLHEPRVLFFDEPTAALDPEAAKIVRDHLVHLIGTLRCTVLLCTHNLAEAERICHRVTIIHQGRGIVEGTPAELKASMAGWVRVTVHDSVQTYLDLVRATPGVEDARSDNGSISYRATRPHEVNPEVVKRLVEAGASVVGLHTEEPPLEEAYLHFMRRAADS